MKRHFCTLFDVNYLTRGLALYRSLERHAHDFVLHVLCMDPATHELLGRLALPRVARIALEDLEDAQLLQARATRSVAEFCWTCTPSLPLHVFERTPGAEAVTYLDADLLFFSSPEALFAEAGAASIVVHEHRFAPEMLALERETGRFNVGWVGFQRDDEGYECLDRWRQQCLDWCHARPAGDKFGDQKYLDEWPSRYPRLHILAHPGAGLGPWNIDGRDLTRSGPQVLIDGHPVVFFHYHGFKLLADGTSRPTSADYSPSPAALELLYGPYARALLAAQEELRVVSPGFSAGLTETAPAAPPLGWTLAPLRTAFGALRPR